MDEDFLKEWEALQAEQANSQLGVGAIIAYAIVMLLIIASQWKVYTKAGKPGWAVLIPIYNIIVLLEIVRKPIWWIVLLLIPIVNFVILIIINVNLAKVFGKGTGFALGLIFLPFIFIPILGFGNAQYQQEEEIIAVA